MTDRDAFLAEFTRDIPRGLPTRRLKRQLPPQSAWQSPDVVLDSELLDYDPDDPGGKVLFGALGDKLIGIDDNRHILTVGGSRSGKSVTVIGNLLFYRGSVLAIDPKGELATLTAARRAALGQKVYVLDPFERATGAAARYRAAFNPLTFLEPGSSTLVEDAGLIADAIVVTAPDAKDPHWDESARNFIEGVTLHVATDPAYQDRRTLLTVRELLRTALDMSEDPDLELFEEDEPPIILDMAMRANAARLEEAAATRHLGEVLAGLARDFYEKRGTERAGVLSSVRRHTKFLDYQAMQNVLEGHDFDLADLKRDPAGITVYLVLPATRMGMCNRWLRMFINLLFDAMEREPAEPSVPVLACLDEFPVLGRMKQLEDAVGQIASFGVRLWVILQDWGQGKALYGDRWESFAGNSGVLQFFGNNDVSTTAYISQRLGMTRIEVEHQGEIGQDQFDKGLSGKTEKIESPNLLAPDEVRQLFARNDRLKRQLVHWVDYHPMILQRVEYFDEDSPHHAVFKGKYQRL